MTALTANLVLQTLLASAGAQPYHEAYKTSEETGRPLLVLVGADWCPGCRVMKHSTLAGMEKLGKLKQVSYSIVNTDAESAIASQMMRGASIPQLILYEKTETGWKRSQITGSVSEGQVEAFIGRAVEQHVRLAKQKAAPVKTLDATGGGQ